METESLRAVRRALRWLKKAEKILAQDLAREVRKQRKRTDYEALRDEQKGQQAAVHAQCGAEEQA